jgi:hypothetical protein
MQFFTKMSACGGNRAKVILIAIGMPKMEVFLEDTLNRV